MKYICNDGGRAAAGYTGKTGDCACRALAIAAEIPYQVAYDIINQFAALEHRGKRKRGMSNARTGVHLATMRRVMHSLGWTWTATMGIGTGCTVHLADGELPMGRLIVSVSKHYCAVIDGVIHDTHDPSERGTTIYLPGTPPEELPKNVRWLENGNGWAYEPKRCVYGYWRKAAAKSPPEPTHGLSLVIDAGCGNGV